MSAQSDTDSCKYRAYISYSHHDEKWATWLHKALESYRVPRRLVGHESATGIIPRRITPIFRDREELPTAADLGKTVNRALRESANLIVICSPHAAGSRWVNEEILTFKRLGRSDRIFCLIIDGEPNATDKPELGLLECFPDGLRYGMNSDDRLTDQPLEPIAADARQGKDGKTDAKLKIITGIIGVGFDELKRRDQHRHQYRLVAVTAMALTVMVLTTVLAVRAIVAEEEAQQHRAQAEDLISFMLGDLREKLAPIGRLDVLDAVGDKATAYFESLGEDDLTLEALKIRNTSMRQIGEVRMAQGRLDPAMEAFQSSLSDAELLVRLEPDNNDAQFLLAQTNFWIGYVHLEQGDIERTLLRFQNYLDISKVLVEKEPMNETWLRELGYAYTNLGTVFNLRGESARALEHFQGDQAIGKILVERNPDDLNLRFDLAEATSWVGSALSAVGDLHGALEQFREEVAIKNRLVAADSQNTLWKRRLSLGHLRVGQILDALGNSHEALDSFQTALSISQELAALDPSNANWRRDVAWLLAATGRIAVASDNPQEALASFESYRRTTEALLAEDASKTRWQRDLAEAHMLIGIGLKANGDREGAEFAVEDAIEDLTILLSEHPDDRGASRFLSEAYLIHGQLKLLAGNDEQARAAWLRSLEIIEPLAQETRDYRILNINAQVLLYLNRIEEASPIVERLAAMGFADPAFVDLCDSKGLSARLDH
jgi:tetratricopeptide (TPR) repeat protein